MKAIILASTAILAAGFSPAFAAGKCDVPAADWQPREALQSKLEKQGWQVRRIKSEQGCYEAYAIDASGKRVEAMFNPKTLAPMGGDTDGDEG